MCAAKYFVIFKYGSILQQYYRCNLDCGIAGRTLLKIFCVIRHSYLINKSVTCAL